MPDRRPTAARSSHNPVAAAVSFQLFALPAIRKLLGRRDLSPRTAQATVSEPLDNRGQRRHYVRVRLDPDGSGGLLAHPAGAQGAGNLTSLVQANGLLVVPEEAERVDAGARLPVILLDGVPAPAPIDQPAVGSTSGPWPERG